MKRPIEAIIEDVIIDSSKVQPIIGIVIKRLLSISNSHVHIALNTNEITF